ncbi:MAG: hypothetical protein COA57_14245 [Flavobacteriales bacterium]|nr:MAG: hypothetical protein COA57_14245 [Flavobacteriales bacterium]
MKIYHLLSSVKRLEPTSGDKINEINLLRALSLFSDVYYNNQYFSSNDPDYGLKEAEITVPSEKFDLYYIRNNIEIFRQLPHPKVWVALPYNEEAFKSADAVLTFNEPWKRGLEQYNDDSKYYSFFSGVYPKKIIAPKKVINIGQVLNEAFQPGINGFPLFRYKAKYGMGFTVGYFGRITEETMPRDYLSVLPQLKKQIQNLETVIAGSIRTEIPDKSIRISRPIAFEEMPCATTACDVILANEQDEANWAGSAKPLEAMGCGIPIILTKRPSRVTQLGEEYPLFYTSADDMAQKIIKLYNDKEFYKEVSRYMIERAQQFYPEARAKDLKQKLS